MQGWAIYRRNEGRATHLAGAGAAAQRGVPTGKNTVSQDTLS